MLFPVFPAPPAQWHHVKSINKARGHKAAGSAVTLHKTRLATPSIHYRCGTAGTEAPRGSGRQIYSPAGKESRRKLHAETKNIQVNHKNKLISIVLFTACIVSNQISLQKITMLMFLISFPCLKVTFSRLEMFDNIVYILRQYIYSTLTAV